MLMCAEVCFHGHVCTEARDKHWADFLSHLAVLSETVLLIGFTNLAKLTGKQTSALLLSQRSQYWDGRPCATTLSFNMCSEYPRQVPMLAPQALTDQSPGPRGL